MVDSVETSTARAASSAQTLETLRPEIVAALARAFPGERIEGAFALTGGRSGAPVLSVRVSSKSYVLKQDARAGTPLAGEVSRSMACMRIASDVGVAPKVILLDEVHGISIAEQLTPVAPAESTSERAARRETIVRALRRLHDGPRFPSAPGVLAFEQGVDALLAARGAPPRPARLAGTMKELWQLTERYHAAAPCHRELNPGNVIVTADSAYFVDWDAAGQGDPFFDLAELSVFETPDPALRAHTLALYLGRAPSVEESARATLARVHALGFFATVWMYVAVHAGRPWSESAKALPLVDVFAQMRASAAGAPPDIAAMSLLEEMGREVETEAYGKAKGALRGR